eukprot:gene19324-21248_t
MAAYVVFKSPHVTDAMETALRDLEYFINTFSPAKNISCDTVENVGDGHVERYFGLLKQSKMKPSLDNFVTRHWESRRGAKRSFVDGVTASVGKMSYKKSNMQRAFMRHVKFMNDGGETYSSTEETADVPVEEWYLLCQTKVDRIQESTRNLHTKCCILIQCLQQHVWWQMQSRWTTKQRPQKLLASSLAKQMKPSCPNREPLRKEVQMPSKL